MNKLRFLMVTLSLLLFSAKKAEAASSYIQKVLFDISAEIADSANYHLRIPQWRYGEHSGNVSIWKGQLDALGAPSANRRLVYRMSFAPAGGGNIPQGQWEQYNLTFSLNLPVIPNNAPVGTVVQGTPVAWTRATGSLNAYNWFKVSILARKKGPSPSEVEYFASVYGYNHTTQDDQEQDKLIDIPSYFPIGGNTICDQNPDLELPGCSICPGNDNCELSLNFPPPTYPKPNNISYKRRTVPDTNHVCYETNAGSSECQSQHAVDVGNILDFKANPAPGCTFTGWDGTSAGSCGTTPTCKVTVVNDPMNGCGIYLGAHFSCTAIQRTLTVSKSGSGQVTSSPSGINCGNDCTQNFNNGTSVTLTATPAQGYHVDSWTGCNWTGNTCTTEMTSNVTSAISFVANQTPQKTLTVSKTGAGGGTITSAPAGISCSSGTCSHDYNAGTSVTLSHDNQNGVIFTGWSGDCSGTGACVVTMDEAHSVTGNFAVAYTLGVQRNGPGGSVSSSKITGPGINCPGNCSESFVAGSTVTVYSSTTAQSGYATAGFSGPCKSSTNSSCIVEMDGNKTVTGTFNLKSAHSLTVNIANTNGGTGTVQLPNGDVCSSTCSGNPPTGSDVELQANPAPGSGVFWGGCASVVENVCKVFLMPGLTTVTATFIKN